MWGGGGVRIHHIAFRFLVLQPELKRLLLAVKAWNPNHWATRELPVLLLLPWSSCINRSYLSPLGFRFRQLVSGAETLNLVAEILKSIDRISEIKDQGEES